MALPSACAGSRRLFSMQRGACGVTRTLYRSLITGSSSRCVSLLSPSVHARRTTVILNHLCRFTPICNMSYSIVERGAPNSLDYRVFFTNPMGKVVSPFHDIPLYANTEKTEFNMVVEIPRWTNAKMEISKEERMNPIKQDVKKGKLRYVKNIFPHHGYIWNYGAFPQTWEDPAVEFQETKTKGDKDPLDVCEIGYKVQKRGAVIRVKVLGTMCLIDEGETDWKVIAIDVTDPLAAQLNDIGDVEEKMPGFLKATYEWFKYYKVPDGKPVNQFAWDGEAKNKDFALTIVKEAYEQWQNLVGKTNESGIACENTCVAGSPYSVEGDDAQQFVQETTAPASALAIDPEVCVDKWYYPIP
ncbi:inorganic pyrophosphatase-like [Haliotis rufescens]|uniref:inorganic pyrophosphatase-like n=1 Tax=Haliotis rufescens TaxID=6454 RepID=UPI00201EBE0A|nr:inorganic pyrophosphatase-like [Haliotis rufescens]